MDIAKILQGRAIIEAYRADQLNNPNSETLLKDLKALGFDGIQAFFDASEYANHIERIRCYELVGDCDDCEGRDKGCLINCQQGYVDLVVAVAPDVPKLRDGALKIRDTSDYYRQKALNDELSLIQIRRIFAFFYTWRNFPNYVPPGCSCRFEKVKEPDFDIFWEMPKGIDPEMYQTLKTARTK